MKQAHDISTIKQLINDHRISLLYISSDDCTVCHAILPKLETLLQQYPKISSAAVSVNEVPEVSGEYLVFSIPTILLFMDGKEVLRESRFIQFAKLQRTFQLFHDHI